jgi:hypothetical protein
LAKASAATIQKIVVGQIGKTMPIAPSANAIMPRMRQAHMRAYIGCRASTGKAGIRDATAFSP